MIPFIKMHGCGNDYVFLDCFSNPVPKDPAALARAISDRNRGVGGDGLVLMLPSQIDGAVARMRMFNSDGSEGSLCGNALRCMAMWLQQSELAGPEFRIVMGDRLMPVSILHSDVQNRAARVRIEVGPPVVQSPSAVGRLQFVRTIDLSDLHLPKLAHPPQFVSMGNPHTILFVNSIRDVDFNGLGPAIECHHEFPSRTNVEFVELQHGDSAKPSAAKVRVWERGSGETMACGSGACAVAVAGLANGLLADGVPIHISMRGGNLAIVWDASNDVFLEGPAEESFRGSFPETSLSPAISWFVKF
ncbi:MAG: diaminopimelate epimerase [Planctomycetaceae bacterium]